jgi:hypothetical protein
MCFDNVFLLILLIYNRGQRLLLYLLILIQVRMSFYDKEELATDLGVSEIKTGVGSFGVRAFDRFPQP